MPSTMKNSVLTSGPLEVKQLPPQSGGEKLEIRTHDCRDFKEAPVGRSVMAIILKLDQILERTRSLNNIFNLSVND